MASELTKAKGKLQEVETELSQTRAILAEGVSEGRDITRLVEKVQKLEIEKSAFATVLEMAGLKDQAAEAAARRAIKAQAMRDLEALNKQADSQAGEIVQALARLEPLLLAYIKNYNAAHGLITQHKLSERNQFQEYALLRDVLPFIRALTNRAAAVTHLNSKSPLGRLFAQHYKTN